MTVTKKLYVCECGYATHFEKALEAHCRFRRHKPLAEKAEPKKAEKPIKAEEPKPAEKTVTVKKTRKPRTRKAVKE